MAKKVKLLCDPTIHFSIGDESFQADALTVEQAEIIAAQYPGQYLEVVVEPDKKAAVAAETPKN